MEKRRVLVVDNNRDLADSLSHLLMAEGYEVEVAYDGAEALSHAQIFYPHAVILDIAMPELNGLEVARTLRADPAHRETRLIAYSGCSGGEDRVQSSQAGFDWHIAKPAGREEFLRALNAGAR